MHANTTPRGVQFKLNWNGDFGATRHNLEIGVRYHEDEEDRLQRNSSYHQENAGWSWMTWGCSAMPATACRKPKRLRCISMITSNGPTGYQPGNTL